LSVVKYIFWRFFMRFGSRLFFILFGLPFFAVGLFMLYSIITTFYQAQSATKWAVVPAQILDARLDSSYSDGSTSYEAKATYQYQYQGRFYTNSKVGLGAMFGDGGSDNIGSYQEDMGHKLQRMYNNNQPIDVFVNPNNPSEAVIDPQIRWAMVGFKLVFVIIFGGVGFGIIIYGVKSACPADAKDPKYQLQPWLADKNWQTSVIRSDAKMTLYVAWGFAIFWNAISSFIPFVIYDEAIKGSNQGAWFAVIFPLIGLGLLYWAVKETLKWRKFGITPLTMHPFPGEIDGDVAGFIDIKIPYQRNVQYKVKLHNLYTWVSGSGKNRSRHEEIKWAAEDQTRPSEMGNAGTRISFRFKVPAAVNESDVTNKSQSYYFWRLNVSADMPGVDFDRNFTIPVYRRR